MTASQRRRRRSNRRTLNGISLTIIGLSAIVFIIVALAGSHSTKQSPSIAKATPTATTSSVAAAASVGPKKASQPQATKVASPAVAPPSSPAPPVATSASCYPLSDEGTCYEPGEYCRDSDHGMNGVAGDGEQITCEDNDGWRWEPA